MSNEEEKENKCATEFTVEELDRELIARGARIPDEEKFKFPDPEGTYDREEVAKDMKELYDNAPTSSENEVLSKMSIWELADELLCKTRKRNIDRGIWGKDERKDFFKIQDEQVRKNARCVAAICFQDNLIDKQDGFSELEYKHYGKAYNLCACENFYDQPTAKGWICSGFLVKDDVIATAGHCVLNKNVTDLRIFFGYQMSNYFTPVTRVPNLDIYKGVKIIHCEYKGRSRGPDWALIQLDRKVEDRPPVELSKQVISSERPVYAIGYPRGLPLKYAPGASVRHIQAGYFGADLDIYCGNSGSPVFDSETHEVIGIVARGDNRDLRVVERCWISVIYPKEDRFPGAVEENFGPECTSVSEFIGIVNGPYE